jgi:DNA-binding GntR family transcriptional regulator
VAAEYDGRRRVHITRQSSGDQVAAYIRRMIFLGELKHGDRIRQDDIAAELGVSRIPVREAIIALDREGWVSIEPHRGAFVHGLDENSVRDHYELLGHIYALVARRAVARGDAEAVAALGDIVTVLKATDDPADFSAVVRTFWRQLIGMAHSRRLTSVIRVMPNLVPDNFFDVVPSAIDVQKRGVAAIVRAIKAGDSEKAAEQCIRLLERQADNVVQLLAERDAFRI